MKQRKGWQQQLCDAIEKLCLCYKKIPTFFKRRIVNTVLISLILFYCGCALGMAEKSIGFILWTLYLSLCGLGYAGYVFFVAAKELYETVEGTVTRLQKELPLHHLRVVHIRQSDGTDTKLLLDMRSGVKAGKTYCFYFNSRIPSLSFIKRLDASLSLGSFWGMEELKEEN